MQIDLAKVLGGKGALPIQFSWAAARLLVYTFATVCQVDETVFVLLVPSKKMRTLGETFFVYGVNQGG